MHMIVRIYQKFVTYDYKDYKMQSNNNYLVYIAVTSVSRV